MKNKQTTLLQDIALHVSIATTINTPDGYETAIKEIEHKLAKDGWIASPLSKGGQS